MEENSKHRVIGIRHALKELKDKGLISDEIMFPADASEQLIELIITTALQFYELGAQTGVSKAIDYFMDGKLVTHKRKDSRVIKAHIGAVTWQHTFPVPTGYTENKVVKQIRIPIASLGFEV